ncbi:hypothetical protein AKJ65_03805 [candidate division MSBL1 archaeon SCGC-AAA259E19]|uniref:Methenyltetrahydromethanopterin cyclohydrolase n=2 Tax=candidate division MSBL1 TaxID=215777 RepID=A0A133V3J2_9EURY|nr:hypothetical protein AKJ65_03805 [candidate division MSBL1 archaeon SCGC-AAA259E19]KXB01005.1 hypothetical protein AKJ41_03050 [candidate division MSBL1 archaeon SCGC-AAA259O05]
MKSLNQRAKIITEKIIEEEDSIGVNSFSLENGTKVLDLGVEEDGGLKAGRYLSEACMSGLGEVNYTQDKRPKVHVTVDEPVLACMASQYAGWSIEVGDYSAMGSGPARALAKVEDLFEEFDYEDPSGSGVLTLEGREFPDEEVSAYIAEKCNIDTDQLYLLVAPTASIVGSVQISARVVEAGIHKLHTLGFDMEKIISGNGSAPIAPIADNDLVAMGKTNDCTLYGGRAIYYVDAEDSEIEEVIDDLPSCASEDYGRPFLEIFEEYDRDFFEIDPNLFSTAEITINNVNTGSVFKVGEVNEEVLEKSLGI